MIASSPGDYRGVRRYCSHVKGPDDIGDRCRCPPNPRGLSVSAVVVIDVMTGAISTVIVVDVAIIVAQP